MIHFMQLIKGKKSLLDNFVLQFKCKRVHTQCSPIIKLSF